MSTTLLDKNISKLEKEFFEPDENFILKKVILSNSLDPSMRSASYIKMTGRKGLSIFKGNFEEILFSIHPNNDNKFIIFPPDNKDGYFDVRALAKILKTTGKTVELIRVPKDTVMYAVTITAGKKSKNIDLDYYFPVHVVSTKSVTQMKGAKFHKFRNKVNACLKSGASAKKIIFDKNDLRDIKHVIRDWAPFLFGKNFHQDIDYMRYVLDEIPDNIHGIICSINEKPKGFTLWEEPTAGYNVANAIVHCNIYDRGVSEFLHYEMAKNLSEKNIPYLSLGGAEQQGLDLFKRKMNPVRSIELETIIL